MKYQVKKYQSFPGGTVHCVKSYGSRLTNSASEAWFEEICHRENYKLVLKLGWFIKDYQWFIDGEEFNEKMKGK